MSAATVRRLSLVSAAGLLLVLPLAAQEDILEAIKRHNEVEAQKTEKVIREKLAEAVILAQTQPAKALVEYGKILQKVKEDAALDEEKRALLKRLVESRIRAAEDAIEGRTRRDIEAAQKRLVGDAIRAEDRQRAADQEKIARRMDTIRGLRQLGRLEEADRLASDLARQHPKNPSIQAAKRAGAMQDRIKQNRTLVTEKERRMLGVYGDIERASIPAVDDITYPKNWKELTKRRSGVKMTAKEQAIMKALESSITASFDEMKFEDVIKWLEDKTGQTILLDKQALDDAMVNYETIIKYKARGVSMRTVLRKILADLGLTYIVKDESIFVTTPAKAAETMSVRAYYLGDLVASLQMDLGPVLNQLQILQNAAQIIDLIQTTIEPQSWKINNGPGTIVFDPARLAIVVKASAEVHYMLGGHGMK
jgi:hypothetical protein